MVSAVTFGKIGPKFDSCQLHMLDRERVELQEAKVMHGIPVDWKCVNLFLVVEENVSCPWSGSKNMSICKNNALPS